MAMSLVMLLGGMGVSWFRAYWIEATLLGAGRQFKGEFLKARSIATRSGRQTAIRFERQGDSWFYSTYHDGNYNGVRSSDIAAGTDARIGGPIPLTGGAPGVRVGVNASVPSIPPDSGFLDTSKPIRFGSANMLSFSPLGTATPGTFYLAGSNIQGAVRVTAGSARVRLMVCRGTRWQER